MTLLNEKITEHAAFCSMVMADMKEGPWKTENHRVAFKSHGFDCLIVRNARLLHWCGYVAIPKDHPFYEKDYDDEIIDISVHGGITFKEKCGEIICHESDNEEVVWLGFDCAHSGDVSPRMDHNMEKLGLPKLRPLFSMKEDHNHYWTEAEVTEETVDLASQLKAAYDAIRS